MELTKSVSTWIHLAELLFKDWCMHSTRRSTQLFKGGGELCMTIVQDTRNINKNMYFSIIFYLYVCIFAISSQMPGPLVPFRKHVARA